jgi:hypothetical protein
MNRTFSTSSMTRWMRAYRHSLVILTALVVAPTPAVAAPSEGHRASTIVLPGATSRRALRMAGFHFLRGRSVRR